MILITHSQIQTSLSGCVLAYRRVPPRTSAYQVKGGVFEFWMEVLEMMVSESGTAAYLRLPA